jgi:hypothetical protein
MLDHPYNINRTPPKYCSVYMSKPLFGFIIKARYVYSLIKFRAS